jgi:hypothetical protein
MRYYPPREKKTQTTLFFWHFLKKMTKSKLKYYLQQREKQCTVFNTLPPQASHYLLPLPTSHEEISDACPWTPKRI